MKLTFRIPSHPEFYLDWLFENLGELDDFWADDPGLPGFEVSDHVMRMIDLALDELDALVIRDKLGYFDAPAEFSIDASGPAVKDLRFLGSAFADQAQRMNDWDWQVEEPTKGEVQTFLLDLAGQLEKLKASTEGSA